MDERQVTVRRLEPGGGGFRVAAMIIKPVLLASSGHDWQGADKIPATGGCVIVANHVTKVDPLVIAHVLYDYGRLPRYLAKADLFEVKGIGWALGKLGQIPVQRMTADAVGAFDAAVTAIEKGGLVVVYPEGTITRDPDLWPMRGKSGAARLALATGVPVIPIGHWGAHEVLRPYSKRPSVLPRKTVHVKVGDPVPLEDLRAAGATPQTINEATDRIMDALTAVVAELRGETPPAQRFDPRAAGVPEIGKLRKPRKDKKDKS